MGWVLHRKDKYGHDTQRYDTKGSAYSDKDRYYQKYGDYGGRAWVVKERVKPRKRRLFRKRTIEKKRIYRVVRAPVKYVYQKPTRRVKTHVKKRHIKRVGFKNTFGGFGSGFDTKRLSKMFGW